MSSNHKGSKKEEKNREELQKTINKIAISIYLSIITLSVNRLNSPIKRQSGRIDEKPRLIYMLPTRDSLQMEGHKLKVKTWKRQSLQKKTKRNLGWLYFYWAK